MLAIKNATLVMRDHLIPEAVLFIENEKIAGFGEMRNTPIPEGCEIIDAQGQYLAPSFLDGHIHVESSMMGVGEYAPSQLDPKVYAFDLVTVGEHSVIPYPAINGIPILLKI